MRHLFIINPIATRVKGRVREITEEIESFFNGAGLKNYHIHVTRWARDGMGYANRFAQESSEPVRIHAVGGCGTLYEAINGTIGLPKVQIAAYPMGGSNFFIHYFGSKNEHLFRSIEKQVNSGVTPIDAMCYDGAYGIGYAIIGLEAVSDRDGSEMIEKTGLPADFCHYYTALKAIFKSSFICQNYSIDIDGRDFSGEYVSMLIAGGPCYGHNMTPAPEAHPNDGILDIYIMKKMSRLKLLSRINAYTRGGHAKISDLLLHERGRKITIAGEKDIIMSMDGEKFYGRNVSYEVVPAAVSFVCPDEIDLRKLPRIYTRPEEGCIGG